jgi:hypothetical protein
MSPRPSLQHLVEAVEQTSRGLVDPAPACYGVGGGILLR